MEERETNYCYEIFCIGVVMLLEMDLTRLGEPFQDIIKNCVRSLEDLDLESMFASISATAEWEVLYLFRILWSIHDSVSGSTSWVFKRD